MGHTTTFAERIARIESRAASGQATGFVTPGVVDESNADKVRAPKVKGARKGRGSYLGALMGGLFTSVTVMAVGVAIVIADAEPGSFDDIAGSFLDIQD